jgi:hypothetical protein
MTLDVVTDFPFCKETEKHKRNLKQALEWGFPSKTFKNTGSSVKEHA